MYKIVRVYYPKGRNTWGEPIHKPNKTIRTGLTLEEARAHCKNPNTRKEGVYFDTYCFIT